MGMVESIKVSALPEAETLEGFYALGVDGDGRSVKTPVALLKGNQGASAYEVAVEEGYDGTPEQWLLSLRGEKGETGATGAQGPRGETGPEGPAGPAGPAGGKGDKGDPFTFGDFTPEQIGELRAPLTEERRLREYEGVLEADRRYRVVVADDIVFEPPVPEDTLTDHSILLCACVEGDYTIDWGAGLFYGGEVPTVEAGYYDFIYTYEPQAEQWCVGVIKKG
ncbi:hypothetical protein [Gallalistipes aquisgranensis]|uniref:hypothetical protein n=1 Tax=Gallalistipes aquisgranensis TaxID=2779358 RepID=UPI001CF8E927|nr:hypothetical protein [Gallalistipes aquisgranensis]MBE5033463.1 hypothetical protein [Gallalistipes aquisgranensis]